MDSKSTPKTNVLTPAQQRDNQLTVLIATSESVGRPMTDEEFHTQLVEWGVETSLDEVTKLVNYALKEGALLLARTKVPDTAGKKMLRQTGTAKAVPDGMDVAAVKEAKELESVDALAAVVAVRLGTALRRQENIDLPIATMRKHLSDAFNYIRLNGGTNKSAMKLLEGEG